MVTKHLPENGSTKNIIRSESKSDNGNFCNTVCKTYTEAFSGGIANGGSGNFSSNACVITSESETQFSSNFITGTLPSGFSFKNLYQRRNITDKANGQIQTK